jgi:hypothetical protein
LQADETQCFAFLTPHHVIGGANTRDQFYRKARKGNGVLEKITRREFQGSEGLGEFHPAYAR